MISSPPEWSDYTEAPIEGNWLKRWFKSRFRYVDYPFMLGYRGYGNQSVFIVQGHVFRGMALSKPRRKYSPWKNFVSLIKMFLVRTVADAKVRLKMKDICIETHTSKEGFFEFQIENHQLKPGWHKVHLELVEQLVEGQEKVDVYAEVLIQHNFEYGLISDIDDTFLVSHVTRFWQKFYLLLTKNAETRKPFKGVVNFYQSLGEGVTSANNPFFYVSSSEWNLYDFLLNFCKFNKLPRGVLQLKDLKDHWMDFFKSGYGSHDHKRIKIERVLAMFPDRQFILLGDNGQHDPQIYHSIAQDYPGQIKAIYIRAVRKSHSKRVNKILKDIDKMDIPSLQFKRSAEAVSHARQHGFIR